VRSRAASRIFNALAWTARGSPVDEHPPAGIADDAGRKMTRSSSTTPPAGASRSVSLPPHVDSVELPPRELLHQLEHSTLPRRRVITTSAPAFFSEAILFASSPRDNERLSLLEEAREGDVSNFESTTILRGCLARRRRAR